MYAAHESNSYFQGWRKWRAVQPTAEKPNTWETQLTPYYSLRMGERLLELSDGLFEAVQKENWPGQDKSLTDSFQAF